MTFSEFRQKVADWLDHEWNELDHECEVSADGGKTWTTLDQLRVRVSFQRELPPPVNGGTSPEVNKS